MSPSHHKRSTSLAKQSIGKARVHWFALVLAAGLAAGPAGAAIQKCTGADGRIVFSDKPCEQGQASEAVRAVALPDRVQNGTAQDNAPAQPSGRRIPSADSVSSSSSEAARAAMMVRIRAAQTPECLALSDRIQAFGATLGAPAPSPATQATQASQAVQGLSAEMQAVFQRFETQCAARAKEAIRQENERRAQAQLQQQQQQQQQHISIAEQTQQQRTATECTAKRRAFEQAQSRTSPLTPQDAEALAVLRMQVSRSCP